MTRRTLLFLPAAAAGGQETVFRADVRMVEVYVNIVDGRGRLVDGLARDRFQVLDDGVPQQIAHFEAGASELSCAVLFDTTGSMGRALPVVKNAILKMIGQLRDNDWVAVYGFSTKVTALQDFTRDRDAARRAVLAARAMGGTALFDAISQVARLISSRGGKKVIVLFTDGKDNASVLSSAAATTRVHKIGVPIYTVAQGEALQSSSLLDQLKDIARRTGGLSFRAPTADDVEPVFDAISRELRHTYLMAYKPPADAAGKWRSIQVAVSGLKDHKIRAKEGYLPE